MKYILATVFAFTAVAFSTTSNAQAIPEAKIAVVDNRLISSNAAVAIDINRQVAKIQADMQTEMQTKGNALRTEEEELKGQSAIMPQEAYNQKVAEFQQKAVAYQREVQLKSRQLEVAIATANTEVERALKPILQKILQETGATILLEKAFVLEQAPGLDVTTRVIEELDLAMPTTTVVLPELPADVAAALEAGQPAAN
ncbi:OmpH family outer membrane protein [Pseudemcibacter aquimaris]|nr:OmpH family outer membrane protein [Pseudemcibacter aquimaris]